MSGTSSEGVIEDYDNDPDVLAKGNDNKEKYDDLINLVTRKSIRDSDLAKNILNMLVDGKFDLESNFVIKVENDLSHVIRLLNICSSSQIAVVVTPLTAMIRMSVINQEYCRTSALMDFLLNKLGGTDLKAGFSEKFACLVGELGKYSISVPQMKQLLGLLECKNKKWPKNATDIISALNSMTQRNGPDEFFFFPGLVGSGIILPPVAKWPQKGWTFHCWCRLDPLGSILTDADKPYLYHFGGVEGTGYFAQFSGSNLIVSAMGRSVKLPFEFHVRKWYMLTIAHTMYPKRAIVCYINGNIATSVETPWIVGHTSRFDRCSIGCSPDLSQLTTFSGQLSTVYAFSVGLDRAQVQAIYNFGMSYSNLFCFENEIPYMTEFIYTQTVFRMNLAEHMVFVYSPLACKDQLCPQSAPSTNFSHFVHFADAYMRGGVRSVISRSVYATLHTFGGIQALFPIMKQLEYVETEESSYCEQFLLLIGNLLENSLLVQQQMVQCKGFMCIGLILQNCSSDVITEGVVDAIIKVANVLTSTPTAAQLVEQLADNILFTPSIWINAQVKFQRSIFLFISTEFVQKAQIFDHTRRVTAIQSTLHSLKFYYWAVNPQEKSGIAARGIGKRPSPRNIMLLRSDMIKFMYQLMIKGSGVVAEQLQAILNYLTTIKEDENLIDVIDLAVRLMAEHPASMVPIFDQMYGVRAVFKLLSSNNERIRIQSLKFLGYFLKCSTYERKEDVMTPHGLYSLIADRLLTTDCPLSMATYNVLFEILTENMTLDHTTERLPKPTKECKLENPIMLKVISQLIRFSAMTPELMAVKEAYIEHLSVVCTCSKDNRRALLQMPVWQDWLFSLAYISPKNITEQTITDRVMLLVRSLLHHSMKHNVDGWRIWMDTMAILHGRVAYYEYKAELLKIYQKNEKVAVKKQGKGKKVTDFLREVTLEAAALVDDTSQTQEIFHEIDYLDENGKTIVKPGRKGVIHRPLDYKSQASPLGTNRKMFKLSQRDPPFVIPDFRYSTLHIQLVSDLLHVLEHDIYSWQMNTMRSIVDFVNSASHNVYVTNMTHAVGQLIDNMVSSCGGLLPLLAAATSEDGEVEMLEPTLGMSVKQAMSILCRLATVVDIIINASALHMEDLEIDKNMSKGSLMRQFMRLSLTLAIRNILEVKHMKKLAESGKKLRKSGHIEQLIRGARPPKLTNEPVAMFPHGAPPVQDYGKSIQDSDVSRIKSCVYRDIEETKQSEFLALISLYFVASIVVSENGKEFEEESRIKLTRPSASAMANSILRDDKTVETADKTVENEDKMNEEDNAPTAEESYSKSAKGLKSSLTNNSERLSDILEKMEDERGDSSLPSLSSISSTSKTKFKKGKGIHEVFTKKLHGTSGEVEGTDWQDDNDDAMLSLGGSSSDMDSDGSYKEEGEEVIGVPEIQPDPTVAEKLYDLKLREVLTFLRQVLSDLARYFSKLLPDSSGQDQIYLNLRIIRNTKSLAGFVKLICSTDWQNAVQRCAGLAFVELDHEGRMLSHANRDYIVKLANEAELILDRLRAEDIHKHAEFEELCKLTEKEQKIEEILCDKLINSALKRNNTEASETIERMSFIAKSISGFWSNSYNKDKLQFWMLDSWEDDSRRRRRMVENPFGNKHQKSSFSLKESKGTLVDAINDLNNCIYSQMEAVKRKDPDPPEPPSTINQEELHLPSDTEMFPEDLGFEKYHPLYDFYIGPVVIMSECQLIAPGLEIDGNMQITETEIYFEIDEESESNKTIDSSVLQYIDDVNGRWHFREIKGVLSRRYLHQRNAVEIFLTNRGKQKNSPSIMFTFPDSGTMKKVISALPEVGLGTQFSLPETRRCSRALPSQLLEKSSMTAKWQRREISNFDYIMFLNTIAGRTYNDLNQYPVFPWVISNYTTNALDLTLPSNFRDLTRPIGALNPARRAYFEERFYDWSQEEIPPFHYGTHYSTAAYVLNWLIRLEPYTTFFINWNNGKFDHANHRFFSIAEAWENCQGDTSDVRELIPEFYYLPEMFVNANDYSLSINKAGKKLSDVVLPPWAKSPEEFVSLNRRALESEFVSRQLHRWIDLIFGYKQRGQEAARATNLFFYLTYEDSVNLERILSPSLKQMIKDKIKNFGQTPSQLLIDPHPPRHAVLHISNLLYAMPNEDCCMILKFISSSPVVHISCNTHRNVPVPAVTTVASNRTFTVNKFHNTGKESTYEIQLRKEHQYVGDKDDHTKNMHKKALPLSTDHVVDDPKVFHTGRARRNLGFQFDKTIKANQRSFTTTSDNRYIMVSGFWDRSFRILTSREARIVQVVFGHLDVVTIITRSECNINQDCFIATGSKDCTVMVWYWDAKQEVIMGENGRCDTPTPKALLIGHTQTIVDVYISAEHGIVISCSQGPNGGYTLVHEITGELLHCLQPPANINSPSLISFSQEGYIIIHYLTGHIVLFAIHGKLYTHIACSNKIWSMIVSKDGEYLILGGENGIIEVWRCCDLCPVHAYAPCEAAIKTLVLTHDEKYIMAGTGSGSVVVFNIDFIKWDPERQGRFF